LTHFVYDGVIDTKGTKEGMLNINTINSGSFLMNEKENPDKESINYTKFEMKKQYEPVFKPPSEKETSTNTSFRPMKVANEQRKNKVFLSLIFY